MRSKFLNILQLDLGKFNLIMTGVLVSKIVFFYFFGLVKIKEWPPVAKYTTQRPPLVFVFSERRGDK